jgi:hypothetical protein
MLRGMPLKEIHLRPTSRMSSAAATSGRDVLEEEAEAWATLWRTASDSGELRVKVAADYPSSGVSAIRPREVIEVHTERVTQGFQPRLCLAASLAIAS